MNTKRLILGYTQEDCGTWPVNNGTTLSIRKISKDLTTCYSIATRSSNTTYDLNEVIRTYVFRYDYENPAVEEKSISTFNKIIETYHPDKADLSPERENKICMAFYKKLSTTDAFGIKFHEMTRVALKGKKKDTLQDMYMRLSDHLAASRQIVNDAYELGNNNHKWETPIDDPNNRAAKRLKTALSGPSSRVSFPKEEESPVTFSKPITKRKPEYSEYPGMDRETIIRILGSPVS